MRDMTFWSCIKHACPHEMSTKKFRNASGKLRFRHDVKVFWRIPQEKWSISLANSGSIDSTSKIALIKSVIRNNMMSWGRLHLVTITGIIACSFLVIPSADAVDVLKTYTCLMKECRIELAKCMANPSCAANIACVEVCNNRPDEKECQIKCNDMFQNSVVDEFNKCAISRKKCVPNKSDQGEFPEPNWEAIVKSFNLSDFTGKWYISSGLNPMFDTYDCQLHQFKLEGDKLVGSMTWRIQNPDTGFFTRSTVQKFVQDPSRPGVLYNHDNEYLHYQDEWYIIASKVENKPDDYIFVYYRGRNDAWDGYGGAVLYTRTRTVPTTIIPELQRAAKSINHDFSQFIPTDNKCGPQPPFVERIAKTVKAGAKLTVKEVQKIERNVLQLEKTELNLLQRLVERFRLLKFIVD